MSVIFDFIHKAKTIDLLNNREFNYELSRLFESAVYEIKGLPPKDIEYILSEVNNSIERYRIYFSEYPHTSKINLENIISVFRYRQLIGHIFEIRDGLLDTNLDKALLNHIYVRMSSNKGFLMDFKKKIKYEYPKLIEHKPKSPQVLKQLFLFSNIALENPPQLKTNLTNDQRSMLFELLVIGEFIPKLTDKESFEWALGSNKQPVNWQAIFWNYSKHALRILLTPIIETITEDNIRTIKNIFLDNRNKPFDLPKDEYRFTPEYIEKIQPILISLNLEKSKWYTGEKKPTI